MSTQPDLVPGRTVIVKTTGRRAIITAELPKQHYSVEFLPAGPADDPLERDSPDWEGEADAGIYTADDLEPVP
jgi:hypothetical protein